MHFFPLQTSLRTSNTSSISHLTATFRRQHQTHMPIFSSQNSTLCLLQLQPHQSTAQHLPSPSQYTLYRQHRTVADSASDRLLSPQAPATHAHHFPPALTLCFSSLQPIHYTTRLSPYLPKTYAPLEDQSRRSLHTFSRSPTANVILACTLISFFLHSKTSFFTSAARPVGCSHPRYGDCIVGSRREILSFCS